MPTRKSKPNDTEPDIQILTTTKCPSLSGRSEITYSIGIRGDNDMHLKLVNNSGPGQFTSTWILLDQILKLLKGNATDIPFSSSIFDSLCTSQSSNNAGFLMAAAVALKLVIPDKKKGRQYRFNSADAFLAKVEKLKAAKTNKTSTKRKTKATA